MIKGSQATSQFSAANRTDYTTGTLWSTPDSRLRSPGGSIIAGYEPDPSHPLPRSFESLASYPISPSALATHSRVNLGSSQNTMAFVPGRKMSVSGGKGSTWTLTSYHHIMETPNPIDRRAPPPPPLPVNMPLPPTPTTVMRGTLYQWPHKESREMLMPDVDWIEVENGTEKLDGWSRGGAGIGIIVIISATICYVSEMQCILLIAGFKCTRSCQRST